VRTILCACKLELLLIIVENDGSAFYSLDNVVISLVSLLHGVGNFFGRRCFILVVTGAGAFLGRRCFTRVVAGVGNFFGRRCFILAVAGVGTFLRGRRRFTLVVGLDGRTLSSFLVLNKR
jgi:hypothetical protein